MKKLWKRAAGKIKDRNSIWVATFASRNSGHRQPDLEAAVIKATSHDDSYVDYKNAQRVFTWVRTSPTHLIVFLWALTRRAQRTRNWIVALKSIILLHGVLCTKAPGTRKIGRLPFDLSSFEDQGSRGRPRTQFLRAYFAFCDLKSVILSSEMKDGMAMAGEAGGAAETGAGTVLVRVQRWQDLLDAVMEVRPYGGGITNNVVVLEVMDCMVIEVFELYSKICDGIAKALMKIYKEKVGKEEASMALDILHKASKQGRDLSDYFHFCTKIGILHLTECPKIQQMSEDDFFELKRIINGDTDEIEESRSVKDDNMEGALIVVDERREIVEHQGINKPSLKTVITDKWVMFDEEINKGANAGDLKDPFEASLNFPPAIQFLNPFVDYGGTPPSQLRISLL
ncbi:hypothetical protein RND81_12G056800 [Saponaria officinalis]|uniref:ENTH domain-containing protein n=1 Tax=Saponaria officinalis TaxID=3572 RepID=A0AAW1H585_SAPOF